ncbi:MAG: hypothetical protein ACE14V_05515 [bacterium]
MLIYLCDRCGREIPNDTGRYTLKSELFASKTPIVYTEKDRNRNYRKEIAELIQQMEHMNPDELNDEVYVSYQFDLCKPCRDQLYQEYKRLLPLSK